MSDRLADATGPKIGGGTPVHRTQRDEEPDAGHRQIRERHDGKDDRSRHEQRAAAKDVGPRPSRQLHHHARQVDAPTIKPIKRASAPSSRAKSGSNGDRHIA